MIFKPRFINRFKRSKSICETIDNNAVHLTKENTRNGIIIFYTDRYTCVISDRNKVDDVPLFLLIKEFNEQDEKIILMSIGLM